MTDRLQKTCTMCRHFYYATTTGNPGCTFEMSTVIKHYDKGHCRYWLRTTKTAKEIKEHDKLHEIQHD